MNRGASIRRHMIYHVRHVTHGFWYLSQPLMAPDIKYALIIVFSVKVSLRFEATLHSKIVVYRLKNKELTDTKRLVLTMKNGEQQSFLFHDYEQHQSTIWFKIKIFSRNLNNVLTYVLILLLSGAVPGLPAVNVGTQFLPAFRCLSIR